MTPWDLIIWAGAAAVALIVVGLGMAVALSIVGGAKAAK